MAQPARPTIAPHGAALLAATLGLLLAAPTPAGRVGLRVDVVQVSHAPQPSGPLGPAKRVLRELLRHSPQTALSTHVFELAVGEPARLALPNGARVEITPLAIESDRDVRLKIAVTGESAFEVELSVPSGESFQLVAGRSPGGHLLLTLTATER